MKRTDAKNDDNRCNGRNPIKDDMGNCDVSGVAEKLQVLCHGLLSAVTSENFLVNPLLGFAGRWTDIQFDLAATISYDL